MSRNREPVKPVESESESGEEDDDASSEEESDSEPEQTPTSTQKNSAKPQQTPPQPQPPPSSSEEEEESGSETESESDEPESNVKPLASKPIDEPQKSSNGAKNSRSKLNASVPATPTKPVAAKRPAAEEVSTPKDAKKKKTNDPETSEKKSNTFQRLFTEDDEIVILQGMSDYKSEKNADPVTDLNGFHEFIKKKLHTDFTRAQLQDKIRRLKKKFENNKGKEKKEGKVRLFAKSHEQKSYDLSKLLWENVKENGVEGAGSVARKTPNKKVNGTASEEVKNAVVVGVKNVKNAAVVGEPKKLNSDGGASMEEMMLKIGREVYEAGQGIEGENEWHNLRVEELQLYLKQLEVRAAQTKLVLGVIKPQDH